MKYGKISFSRIFFCLPMVLAVSVLIFGCSVAVPRGNETKAKADTGCTIVDIRGDKVYIPKKPRRIMTYEKAMDEIVLGLTDSKKMIAVNSELVDPNMSNVAEYCQNIPNKISRNPSVEATAALRPDIVFVHTTSPIEKVEALRDLGITTIVCPIPRKYSDILLNIRMIAKGIGEAERGEKLIGLMEKRLSALKEKIARQPKEKKEKRIAFISIAAGYGGEGCIFDDHCRFAEAKNAKALYGIKSGTAMTKEQLIDCDPDYIFVPFYGDNSAKGEKFEKRNREYMDDPSLQTMKAVRNGNVCHPLSRYMYNLSQNFVFGVQETAHMIYGEEFKPPMNGHISAIE